MSFRAQVRIVADVARPTQTRVDRLWSACAKFGHLGADIFSTVGNAVGVRDGTWTSAQLIEAALLLTQANESFAVYWADTIAVARVAKRSPGYRPQSMADVYDAWYAGFFGPSADDTPIARSAPGRG